MGYVSFTMRVSEVPAMYALACLDALGAVRAAGEVVLWPTVLARESEDYPGGPRRLTVSARTTPCH